MVDFSKRLNNKDIRPVSDPIQLYQTLDRHHDKGPLRPAQIAVLTEWYANRSTQKDNIIKLHTGQGKTLVGLLILRSLMNKTPGRALYLCPDNYLVDQTCEQAKQFGIPVCRSDGDLPDEYLSGKAILIAPVQKLFNGLTKFGLNQRSENNDYLLMDDAHACSDIIRDATKISLPKDDPAYAQILGLFANDLEKQGVGTFADIKNGNFGSLLPMPYWAWNEHEDSVARILSGGTARPSIKFAWPLIKDILRHCQCIVSSSSIEIEPRLSPLDAFGTYWNAKSRFYMSATVTNDAFLITGLRLQPNAISNPITYSAEKWSGEKMLLIPTQIDISLNRTEIAHAFGARRDDRRYGVVALVSSFKNTVDWKDYGAEAPANSQELGQSVSKLKNGDFAKTIVFANRYNGVDLPDDACRILIVDGKPHSENLVDLYQESCRPTAESTFTRVVRTVEQGLGRSVRGEKDYSAIIIIGDDLVKLIKDYRSGQYFSPQMQMQIQIGKEIGEMASQELKEGQSAFDVLNSLLLQLLNRDAGWKAFYAENMDKVESARSNAALLNIYQQELNAEELFQRGDTQAACVTLQSLIDTYTSTDRFEKGWYLQEMARYTHAIRVVDAQVLQEAAHRTNRYLLRPKGTVGVEKLIMISHRRVENLITWIKSQRDFSTLQVTLADIFMSLRFGVKSDRFENALLQLGEALGFSSERPDKEWKEGPDNLWALSDRQYLLWESKNEVDLNRAEIAKYEAQQLSASAAWFGRHYPGVSCKNLLIHPTNQMGAASAFAVDAEIVRDAELTKFKRKVETFFGQFKGVDFDSLSNTQINQALVANKLTADDILSGCTKQPRYKA